MNEVKLTAESFQPLQKAAAPQKKAESRGTMYFVRRAFLTNPIALMSVALLIVIISVSLLAPLSPYDPDEMDLLSKNKGFSAEHLMGTDSFGRDYFTRILYGGRVSIGVGVFSMLISTIIGTVYGTISGLIGGRLDSLMMRAVDVLLSIPSFLIIVMMNAIMSTNAMTLTIIIGIFSWMSVARIVRTEAMTLKNRDFVLASRGLGAGSWWIAWRHIIRNASSQIIVAASLSIASAILLESVLSFLGFGIAPPAASWGSMLQTAQKDLLNRPEMAIYPGIMILLTVLCFNIIADVLRTALEPKLIK